MDHALHHLDLRSANIALAPPQESVDKTSVGGRWQSPDKTIEVGDFESVAID
jgi:hypothetical protein